MFHTGHGGNTVELVLHACFLLMNGVFFFLMQELGLGSFADLLGYAANLELSPEAIGFSEEE